MVTLSISVSRRLRGSASEVTADESLRVLGVSSIRCINTGSDRFFRFVRHAYVKKEKTFRTVKTNAVRFINTGNNSFFRFNN